MAVRFVLDGQQFTALDGGPNFRFTPAISFGVTCETQAEVDECWAPLTAGGNEGQCGWRLKDPDPQRIHTHDGSRVALGGPGGAAKQ